MINNLTVSGQMGMFSFNYHVLVNGKHFGYADTEQEVWDLLGRRSFGSLYEVRPLSADVSVDNFIPF